MRASHGGALRQHVFFPVAGKQHIQLILGRTELCRRFARLGAGIVQLFLGNGVGRTHGRNAAQIDGGIFRQGRGRVYRSPGLGNLLNPVPALKAGQSGLFAFKTGSGLIPLLGQQISVQPGQSLPFGHAVALIHQHGGYTPANAKGQVYLADIDIAVQRKAACVSAVQPAP